jgi:hypothetical protein
MVFLFRSGTLRQKALTILQLTHTHARNLGIFVLTYKSILLALRHLHGGKEEGLDSFLAGLVGGYLVFGRGRQSSVNQQIVMYVFARVVFGLAKLSVKSGAIRDEGGRVRKVAYPVYVSISWACIMWLFRWHPDTVQTSLRNSMVYLYANADKWDGFGNWLWHNS